MFGSVILDVAIGVIFVFFLTSVVCAAVREGIESWLKTRAAFLEIGIRELLHDRTGTGLAKAFYNHPLIHGLYPDGYADAGGAQTRTLSMFASGRNLPSYIPAKNFAVALLDIAARGPETDAASSSPSSADATLATIRANIQNIQNPAVQRVLLMAIDSAHGDLQRAQENIEHWYDSSMDRVSGWYKRSTQYILFWIGLFAAVALNINTITIADFLNRNEAERSAVVARAEASVGSGAQAQQSYDLIRKDLDALGLPIGWSNGWGSPRPGLDFEDPAQTGFLHHYRWWNYVFAPIIGWLVTAFAASLGAPFWFDVLNKVMVIRSTVKPHEKSPEEDSEDRQRPARPAPPAEAPAVAAAPAATTSAPPT